MHLTPQEALRRAEAMRPTLREKQAQCEADGRLSDEVNEQFIQAGFYRLLQPQRFGGYEFDLPSFVKVMMAISRGCSDSAWVLALTSGHAAILALYPEECQIEVFGDGEMRMPGVAKPGGPAIPVEGGYRIKGAWDYSSGCDLATHFFGGVMIPNTGV